MLNECYVCKKRKIILTQTRLKKSRRNKRWNERETDRRMRKNAPPKSYVTYSGDISSKVSHAQGTATIRRRFIRLFREKGRAKKRGARDSPNAFWIHWIVLPHPSGERQGLLSDFRADSEQVPSYPIQSRRTFHTTYT